MDIIPLGTNGFFPSFGRQTACYAIPFDRTLIILDAGSGLFRLAEKQGQEMLENTDGIHIFLSHYHMDHTIGFYGAWKLLQGKKVTVFAPSDKKVFKEFVADYFPVDYKKEHQNFSWKVIKEGESKIDDYKVLVRKQEHMGSGSLAFRFTFPDTSLAYVTDSEPRRKGIDFVHGVDLLLHEHWLIGEKILHDKGIDNIEDHFEAKHVTSVGAALIAKEANVRKLVLIHHNPFADNDQLEKQLQTAQTIMPSVTIAKDLEVITF